ncbi:hypothetical protein psal_cds_1325 [Pandoravirus salinus]|uniref:Uncharacterized protein n=1 Tax=Pandoravirus salinus TaxID=1349410 RepID=S4W1M4_9VIRU|nr:hypothetical protein psal_cds_1325 [Pandoravirus salinus]AGO85706.1 hypothetical protein psal_cds_1325 [Pandoravirus salinus]
MQQRTTAKGYDWLAVPRVFIRTACSLRQDDIVAVIAARGGTKSLVPRGSLMPNTKNSLLVAFGHLEDEIDGLVAPDAGRRPPDRLECADSTAGLPIVSRK